ncbi:MAG: hypothetical protein JXQ73_08885 [Phycisphaerae bacterium]|nr:hypothetical protein [Phycisphaerae bacterium]
MTDGNLMRKLAGSTLGVLLIAAAARAGAVTVTLDVVADDANARIPPVGCGINDRAHRAPSVFVRDRSAG